eukprot:1878170-Prymnesium_polylepis.1
MSSRRPAVVAHNRDEQCKGIGWPQNRESRVRIPRTRLAGNKRGGTVRCGAVRCGAVRCGAVTITPCAIRGGRLAEFR